MNALCRLSDGQKQWAKGDEEINGLATSGANELGNYSWSVGGAEPG